MTELYTTIESICWIAISIWGASSIIGMIVALFLEMRRGDRLMKELKELRRNDKNY